MRRLVSILATVALAASVGVFASTTADALDQVAGNLSDTGSRAVQDLRECLSSNPSGALDIYYLIDASGSLFGVDGTDPEMKRADILKNSLAQLAKLSDRFTVEYATGFFGTQFTAGSGWNPVGPDETGQGLADEIRGHKDPMGWTNWESAINGAQQALKDKKLASGGCQMLIWLTDGGINLGDDASNTAAAINTLCGSLVAAGGAGPARGLGQFNELRKANVSVFGTLLSVNQSLTTTDRANIPFMQPMIEGKSSTSDVRCGESPVPEGYSNGAFIEATDPTHLSRVFLGLSQSIAGGTPAPIGEDGSFQIDPGVAGFSIISADGGTWSLVSPRSSEPIVSSANESSQMVRVTRSAGALLVDWPALNQAPDSGRWSFVSSADSNPELFRFSGLSIGLDPLPSIVATKAAQISGTITRDGTPALDLKNYDYTLTLLKRVAGTAELTEIAAIDADPRSGVFSYAYTDAGPEGQYDIVARVTDLKTRTTGLPLEDLSTSLPVTIQIPQQFPTISRQPEMSDLVGSSGRSTGSFTIVGPSIESATGQACFSDTLPTPSDSPNAGRDDTWTTSLTVSEKVNGCIVVNHGETRTIEIAMSNSSPANSTVRATLPVSLTSAEGMELNQNVDVIVLSTQPVNAGILWSILLLLVLLGLLIPLALLYAVNYVSAKIGYGSKLQRASFPVFVAPDGTITARSGENLRGSDVGTDNFKFQPPKSDARTFQDADLGALTATPPRNPFGDLIYAITPIAGRLVFTLGRTGSPSSKQAFRTARKATFGGNMSTLAALTVNESEHVAKGGSQPVNGTLVVYTTSAGAGQSDYSTRMAEVLSASKLRSAMGNAREAIRAEQNVKPGSQSTAPRQEMPAATPPQSGLEPPRVSNKARQDPPAPPPRNPRRDQEPPPPRRK